MMELLDEQPRGKQDYDMWISDGVALGKGKKTDSLRPVQVIQLSKQYPQKIICN